MKPKLKISPRCIQCDNCRLICPENAILKDESHYIIETWSCTLCNLCVDNCPVKCINSYESAEIG